jgi:hypothetical protein
MMCEGGGQLDLEISQKIKSLFSVPGCRGRPLCLPVYIPYGTDVQGDIPYGTDVQGDIPYGTDVQGDIPYGTDVQGEHGGSPLQYEKHGKVFLVESLIENRFVPFPLTLLLQEVEFHFAGTDLRL